MVKNKAILAAAIILVLAACQQPNGGARQSATAAKRDPLVAALTEESKRQEKDYRSTPYFKTKIKDLMVDMTDRLLTKCMDAVSETEITGCFRERLLAGFDRDGVVEQHCPAQGDAGDNMQCIIFGGMAWDIAANLDHGSASALDWANPQESTQQAMLQHVAQHLRGCLGSNSASDPFDCVVANITETLDLSVAELDPCAAYKDDDKQFGQCVGEAYAYKYMSGAIARM
jgi:hypothetical protein